MGHGDEAFDDMDVDSAAMGGGVLGGDGFKEHAAVRKSMKPSHVEYQVTCDTCGTRQKVQVTWDELIFCSMQVPPPGNPQSPPWAFEPRFGAMHPNQQCCHCGRRDTLLLMTPDSAQSDLRSGVQAQFVQPGYIQQAQERVRQMAAGYRR